MVPNDNIKKKIILNDLKIRPNEVIGLKGKSGAGKTTLINQLTEFRDVKEGVIEFKK